MPGTQPVAPNASQAASAAAPSRTSAAARAMASSIPSSSKVAKAISAMAEASGALLRGEAAGGRQQHAVHRALGVGDGVPGGLPG